MNGESENDLFIQLEFKLKYSLNETDKLKIKSIFKDPKRFQNLFLNTETSLLTITSTESSKCIENLLKCQNFVAFVVGSSIILNSENFSLVAEFRQAHVIGIATLDVVEAGVVKLMLDLQVTVSINDIILTICEYGDVYNVPNSCGKIIEIENKPLSYKIKIIDGYATTKVRIKNVLSADLVGRSIVLYDQNGNCLSAAVLARSASVDSNKKTICSCDGTTIWESRN